MECLSTCHRIEGTIVGRVFQVDELVNLRRFGLETLSVLVEMIGRNERRSRWIGTDFQRNVVLVFQVGADFSEFGQRRPTRADVARTRHSVTFTLVPHQLVNSLFWVIICSLVQHPLNNLNIN